MWPNESAEYRVRRNALLERECELRMLTEEIAQMRRELPEGGAIREDYVFQRVGDGEDIHLSQMFDRSRNTLFAYSLMFAPGGTPCPMCTAFLDGLDTTTPHLSPHMSVAVIGKATVEELANYSLSRGWKNLQLYSSGNNNYNADYRAEDEAGKQFPLIHIWQKRGADIHHFWASELFFHSDDNWSGHPRHADPAWALWNILDLTPQGRGGWFPALQYD